MSTHDDARTFLMTRRGKVTPTMVGLPQAGARRVPGLRRGEVAMLAGVSVEYYTRVERGDLRGVSDEVLDAIATALRLSDTERDHLFDLARAANAGQRARRRPGRHGGVPAAVRQMVDAITEGAAVVGNTRNEIVATNPLARALYDPLYRTQSEPVSYARYIFLDPTSRDFYVDWELMAAGSVAMLRHFAGRHPFDRSITDVVGELSTQSREFANLWARHDVHQHVAGRKRINHPVVGRLDLDYAVMELRADDDLDLTVYTAQPGSDSEEKLRLLASWWAPSGVAAPLPPGQARSGTVA